MRLHGWSGDLGHTLNDSVVAGQLNVVCMACKCSICVRIGPVM